MDSPWRSRAQVTRRHFLSGKRQWLRRIKGKGSPDAWWITSPIIAIDSLKPR